MLTNNNKGQTEADVGSFLDLIICRLIGGTLKAAKKKLAQKVHKNSNSLSV